MQGGIHTYIHTAKSKDRQAGRHTEDNTHTYIEAVRQHPRTYAHTYIHTGRRTYIHTCMHTYIQADSLNSDIMTHCNTYGQISWANKLQSGRTQAGHHMQPRGRERGAAGQISCRHGN